MKLLQLPQRDANAGRGPVETASKALRDGRFAVVTRSAEEPGEAVLVLAAERADTSRIAFMVRATGGVLGVPMPGDHLERLRIPPMTITGDDHLGSGYAVSVDATHGVTTGISASDRATTIALLARPETRPEDLTRPGHVCPMRAAEGGVLTRPGFTEAAVDLMRLAGSAPVAVLGELVDDDGELTGGHRLREFCARHDIPVVTVGELVAHRRRHVPLMASGNGSRLPTEFGEFRAHGYRSALDGREYLAVVMGDLRSAPGSAPLVAVHSECVLGDAFGAISCECGTALRASLRLVAEEGRGVVLYQRATGGPFASHDTAGCDAGLAARILDDLGVSRLRLIARSTSDQNSLREQGFDVAGLVRPRMDDAARTRSGTGGYVRVAGAL